MPDPGLPVLDEAVLAELLSSTDGDLDFVRDLVETYLGDVPGQLAEIGAALDADDASALVRPAHTLKSASATVGAARLSAVARELEMAGRSGALGAAARTAAAEARGEADEVAKAMTAWLAREAR